MSRQELNDLALEYQQDPGNRDLYTQLVDATIRLIWKICLKYEHRFHCLGYDVADLVQECVALIPERIDRFDPEKGCFNTFLYNYVIRYKTNAIMQVYRLSGITGLGGMNQRGEAPINMGDPHGDRTPSHRDSDNPANMEINEFGDFMEMAAAAVDLEDEKAQLVFEFLFTSRAENRRLHGNRYLQYYLGKCGASKEALRQKKTRMADKILKSLPYPYLRDICAENKISEEMLRERLAVPGGKKALKYKKPFSSCAG